MNDKTLEAIVAKLYVLRDEINAGYTDRFQVKDLDWILKTLVELQNH